MKNEFPEISVIVPVYKVEKYLPKCIESILNQTFTNFELLLIDDGSPDRSGIICDEYALKDNRIRVVHKANGGVSSARNCGLNIAQGKYISFVDSDDWIEPDMYKKILNAIKLVDDNALGVCNYKIVNETDGKFFGSADKGTEVLNREEFISLLYDNPPSIRRGCWNKVFNKKIIGNLRFNEQMIFGEDKEFLLSYVKNITTAVYLKENLYVNLSRTDSASHSFANIEAAISSIYGQMNDLKDIKKNYPNVYSKAVACMVDNWLFKLIYYSKGCPKDKKYLIKQSAKDVLKYYPQILKNNKLTLKYKAVWLFRIMQAIL